MLSPDSVASLNPVYIAHMIMSIVITVMRALAIALEIVLVSCPVSWERERG